MKTDLATTILAAGAGFIVAFLAVKFMIPPTEDFSVKKLDGEITYELAEPDPNVFNYRALNPTVEVFVGSEDDEEEEQPEETLENDTPLEGETNPGGQTNGSSD